MADYASFSGEGAQLTFRKTPETVKTRSVVKIFHIGADCSEDLRGKLIAETKPQTTVLEPRRTVIMVSIIISRPGSASERVRFFEITPRAGDALELVSFYDPSDYGVHLKTPQGMQEGAAHSNCR